MRSINYLTTAIMSSIFAVLVAGSTATVQGQNVNKEYRDWQNAQARAQRECQEYNFTRRNRDYNQCQAAQRRAQEQYAQYQRALGRSNYGYSYTPSFGSPRSYRIYRDGSYYSTDHRGAELLRQAVRNGYAQGYRQGQLDRQYGNRYDYYEQNMYRSGTYGYQSYVARDQYQYYFQQGFQRGYEDGYYSRNRYGTRSGNTYSILGSVLNTILTLAND